MFVYWAIFIVLAAGSLLHQEDSSMRPHAGFILLATVPTALMIGLRWKVGPDWIGYWDIFGYTKSYSLSQSISHVDPGFYTLIWLLHRWNAPFSVLNMVCGTIFVAGLTAFCRRQPNPWLAFLAVFPYLVIVVAMSGDRQSAALGFLFFALNFFERGRLAPFVMLVLVAATFHSSALLIVPISLFSYSRNGLQRAVLLIIAGALAFYFFGEAFSVYARRYSDEKIQSGGVAYRLAMNALAAFFFLLFQRRFELEENEAKLWRNISLCTLGLIVLLPAVPSSTAVDRFLLYFFPLQSFVLSRTPKALSKEGHAVAQATFAIIAYAAAVQATFLLFGTYASYYIPYRTIFNG